MYWIGRYPAVQYWTVLWTVVCCGQHHCVMCGGSQSKYFREGSIGQSKLSPRSPDITADTLRSRVLYRLLFQGHHKAVSVI